MTDVAAGARPRLTHAPHQRADDLQIAGLVPMSSVDWPGRLAATVFCQGCPWDCSYCHNPALIPPRTPGVVPWSQVRTLLARRRGLLDAVVFSGGEATRQHALRPAMLEARELGFRIGLHSAGPYPRRLATVLDVVDWIGLDIKALPDDYDTVVGRPGAGRLAWQSLEEVIAAGIDHEVRTTIAPGSPATRHIIDIARRVREAGAQSFALQVARTAGTRPAFSAPYAAIDQHAWRAQVTSLDQSIRSLQFTRYELRTE